jgi:hypothetical protein
MSGNEPAWGLIGLLVVLGLWGLLDLLLSAADDAAEGIAQELAGRLKALPDRLLPVVGLGLFAPILGLVVLPVAAYLLRLIAASAPRLNVPVP